MKPTPPTPADATHPERSGPPEDLQPAEEPAGEAPPATGSGVFSDPRFWGMLASVVALFVVYWLVVACVLLPGSRVTKPNGPTPATASSNVVPATVTPSGTTNAPAPEPTSTAGWWPGVREALASTDERLYGPRGTFGDMFGAVNALFTGLAFACVFYTILQQREDLKLQQRNLDLQRKDLELQRDELKAARAVAITAALVQARTTLVTAQVAALQRPDSTAEVRCNLVSRMTRRLEQVETAIPALERELEKLSPPARSSSVGVKP